MKGIMDALASPEFRGFAQGLSQAGSPNASGTPVSFGAALGAGMQGMDNATQTKRQREIEQLMLQMKLEDFQRKKKQQAMRDQMLQQMYGGQQAGQPPQDTQGGGMAPSDMMKYGMISGDKTFIDAAQFNQKQGLDERKFKLDQMKTDPEYIAEQEQAKVDGKNRAATIESYKSASSKLPSLLENVGKLSELADEATYMWAGQGLDMAARQIGVTTDGAKARTKFQSMVDNQVLPLLRDTFGAAFTAAEGESLRATLGDVNKSPPEKKAALEAFIEQKVQNLNADAAKLGYEPLNIDPSKAIQGNSLLNDPELQQMGITPEMIQQVMQEEGL